MNLNSFSFAAVHVLYPITRLCNFESGREKIRTESRIARTDILTLNHVTVMLSSLDGALMRGGDKWHVKVTPFDISSTHISISLH